MLSLFFPLNCRVCRRPIGQGGVCRLCIPARVSGTRCSQCYQLASDLHSEGRCTLCRTVPSPLRYQRFIWEYEAQASDYIRAMKYTPSIRLCQSAGALLAERLPELLPAAITRSWCGVVPVPSSSESLQWRGFNPCHLLAKPIARACQRQLLDLLEHRGSGAPQASLLPRERLRNVRETFVASRPLQGESLLLVDDVTTTGATSAACAIALLDAGAGFVDLITLARTPTWQEHRQALHNSIAPHRAHFDRRNGDSAIPGG